MSALNPCQGPLRESPDTDLNLIDLGTPEELQILDHFFLLLYFCQISSLWNGLNKEAEDVSGIYNNTLIILRECQYAVCILIQ